MRHLRFVATVVLTCLITSAGCIKNPVTGRSESAGITKKKEVRLGRAVATGFERKVGGELASEQVQQYVRGVGGRIAAATRERRMPYEYAVLESSVPNAYALPGGKVYVTAGLIRILNSERELAAMLAHLNAHLVAMHAVTQLQQQFQPTTLVETSFGADSQGRRYGRPDEVTVALAGMQHSTAQEYQSDDLGIIIMNRAGYNPIGMVELLGTLQALKEASPGLLNEMCRRHPLTTARVERAQGVVRGYPKAQSNAPDPNAGRFLQIRALLK